METTNVLMAIAVIAVVVAGVNLISIVSFQESGYTYQETGTAEVDIVDLVNIQFTVGSLDWGEGYVDSPAFSTATLQTEVPVTAGWTVTTAGNVNGSTGLRVANVGNVAVDFYLESSKNADGFICGGVTPCTGETFRWQLSEYDVGACSDASLTDTIWTDVTVDGVGDGKLICGQFDPLGGPNELEIDLELVVPDDAVPDTKSVIIQATALKSV